MIYEGQEITPLEIKWINDRINDPAYPYTADTGAYTREEEEIAKEFAMVTCRPYDPSWFRELAIALRKDVHRLLERKPRKKLPRLPSLLPIQKKFLIKSYEHQDVFLDKLAYTKEFEVIAAEFRKKFHLSWSNNEIFRHLLNIRKSGELPGKKLQWSSK